MGALGIGPALALRCEAADATFDFTGGVLPFGATLARATMATRHGADGVLASAGAHVARFDFDPVTLVLRGLLVEEARTNLLTHADGTIATLSTATGVSDSPASLSGFANAVRMADNATNRYAYKNAPHSNGTTYRLSLFVRMDDGTAPIPGLTITSGDFAVIAAGGFAPGPMVMAVGGGLYRIVASYVSAGSDQRFGIAKFAGQSARGLRLSGFQLEAGGGASSPILSGAAATTRAADTLTLDWATRGVPDGAMTARVTFDDLTTQEIALTVAGGSAALPVAALARSRVRRIVSI